ncbi:MAG: RNA-directed DNA polymerase [Pirellulaceae bacterium]
MGYLARKASTQRSQAYWRHSVLKSEDATGSFEYRPFVIGSPTTHLAETWLISLLTRQREFTPNTAVYSYLWPRYTRASHIFAPYIHGYRRREHDVTEAMGGDPDLVAVVLDLKQYYPSINKDRVEERFVRHVLKTDLTKEEKNAAGVFVAQLLHSTGVSGVPIGPPLSHILGNLALENVDFQMSQVFPGRYFRYVDDVVIVVPRTEEESAMSRFRTLVGAEGLNLNETKTDRVSASIWKERISQRKNGFIAGWVRKSSTSPPNLSSPVSLPV